MSMVPPARSMRVGAEVSRRLTIAIILCSRVQLLTARFVFRFGSLIEKREHIICPVPSSIRRDIGQLLIGSLPGTTITPELRSLAKEFQLGGVILFARNIEAPEQVAELAYDVQSLAADSPLWVSVDQEGGRVARLKAPFTEWPPMAALGRSGDPTLATRFGSELASELKAVGITLDYAPVLDIHTNPKNPIIGDRALAETAEAVAQF